jgi:sugar lactone lactonase YvrE
MVITGDGRTLVVGESLGSRYTAFPINPDRTVSQGRVWAQLGGHRDGKSAPDGCCMDADGRIWFADSFSNRFVLVEEGGREVEEIRLPEPLNAYACMLGAADGRMLAMCCGLAIRLGTEPRLTTSFLPPGWKHLTRACHRSIDESL